MVVAGGWAELGAGESRRRYLAVRDLEREFSTARDGDAAGVEAARSYRDSGDSQRQELAQRIGFEACSVPKSQKEAT